MQLSARNGARRQRGFTRMSDSTLDLTAIEIPGTDAPVSVPEPTADDARYAALVSTHRVWKGDLPETITGPRALYLASNAQFGSLQRIGHKRGKQCTARSWAVVATARKFTAQE